MIRKLELELKDEVSILQQLGDHPNMDGVKVAREMAWDEFFSHRPGLYQELYVLKETCQLYFHNDQDKKLVYDTHINELKNKFEIEHRCYLDQLYFMIEITPKQHYRTMKGLSDNL